MPNLDRRRFLASLAAAPLAPAAANAARWSSGKSWQWEHYGGDAGAGRYAPLDQINKSNVSKLKVAWVHNCGDASERPQTTIESTPIVVGRRDVPADAEAQSARARRRHRRGEMGV